MSTKNVEIEVKLRIDDLAAIEKRLRDLGAEGKSERIYERNVRYEDSGETLTPAGRVLRLRQDTRARLTYKEPGENQHTGGVLSRTELEVTVSDFETTDLLLQKIGFHPAWVYEKYRTTYEYLGCEVVLDEMPFGKFVEVEGESTDIDNVLSTLDLARLPKITASYSDLFFRVKEKMRLKFRDLTFENFKGITVPREMFG
jgi:adenylate cyclase class 2